MPQVRYIAKGARLDSVRGVGLMWEPGQVRNVTADVAERLLPFADMWERVEAPDEPGQKEGEIGLSQEEKPAEEPLPVIDFHGMDKAALINFAETNYGAKLDKRMSEDATRHRVIALFGQHEMDKEAK